MAIYIFPFGYLTSLKGTLALLEGESLAPFVRMH